MKTSGPFPRKRQMMYRLQGRRRRLMPRRPLEGPPSGPCGRRPMGPRWLPEVHGTPKAPNTTSASTRGIRRETMTPRRISDHEAAASRRKVRRGPDSADARDVSSSIGTTTGGKAEAFGLEALVERHTGSFGLKVEPLPVEMVPPLNL
jgi:hypothetical protein